MSRTFGLPTAIVAIGLITLAGPSHADTIWSSFPTGSYASEVWSGYGIAGSNTIGPLYTANGFVPSANYDISQIDLGLTYVEGAATDPGIILELVTDNGGIPSITTPEPVGGDVLESWSVTNIPGPTKMPCTPIRSCTQPSAYPPLTVTSVPGVEVLAGETYWLVAFPEDPDTEVVWNNALVYTYGADAPIAQDFLDGGWMASTGLEEQGAFDVLGTPAPLNVPEPSPLLLLGAGLLGLAGWKRTRLLIRDR